MSDSLAQNRIRIDINRHIQFTQGNDPDLADRRQVFLGLCSAVRDRLVERWLRTQPACYELLAKRVYYLSLEFLPGRFLRNYLTSLQIEEEAQEALHSLGYDLEDIEEEEWDAGLGNGGLGRLASCFLDSMATLQLPAYGYGIRYDYGIFFQHIVNGYQHEHWPCSIRPPSAFGKRSNRSARRSPSWAGRRPGTGCAWPCSMTWPTV